MLKENLKDLKKKLEVIKHEYHDDVATIINKINCKYYKVTNFRLDRNNILHLQISDYTLKSIKIQINLKPKNVFAVNNIIINSDKTNISLTSKEEKLLNYITEGSRFHHCKLNLMSTWEQNNFWFDNNSFEDVVNLNEYNRILNTNNSGSRAILGSLQKKNLISIIKDCNLSWIIINEEQFNNIKLVKFIR